VGGGLGGLGSIGLAVGKLVLMVVVVFVVGSRVVPWLLTAVAKLRSSELFTLTVLVLSVAIAVGSAALFGASVALGAFLAGMVVAQSRVSHQAAADALPMRHAFAVLFFVSVGMLLDPSFLIREPLLVLAGLGVVLVVKPLAAMVIVALCGYPVRTALTVALGLAQIGEFSFIVGQSALQHGLIPEAGMHVLVASAMVSITLNPLLFRSMDRIESALRGRPRLWRLLNARHERRAAGLSAKSAEAIGSHGRVVAIIAGYGPVGRVVDAMLRDAKMDTVVIDMNIDTVRGLVESGRAAIYGDATQQAILEEAGIGRASHLVVTLPGVEGLAGLVLNARERNPKVRVIVRTRYLTEGDALRAAGASHVVFEEGETGIALARHVLSQRGMEAGTMDRLLGAIRKTWKMDGAAAPEARAGGGVGNEP
ncbi:MAG: cation:proton antiporter, partial [Phycisphaerales bacterium]|nr:cation:proton antiporter [Phycisphaerales bacterium]